MKRSTIVVFALVGAIAVAFGGAGRLSQAGQWPMYRADAARSGYCSEELPQELELKWTFRARHAPQPAWPSSNRMTFDLVFQPIVAGGMVIFGSSADHKVTALDLATGRQRWSFFTAGPVRFAPAAWNDRLFVAGDDGFLYALRLADGKLLWRHRAGARHEMRLGNGRMISHWPARGGPVVFDDTVYYAAGIWPSDGIYVYALDPTSGRVLWCNDTSGQMYMPQPHGGAEAHSGVPPQGYLVATPQRLFLPTGRAVPAAFRREDGRFEYYRLQENGSIGGTRAFVADRFVCNAGTLLEQESGKLAARAGRGVLSATPQGLLQSTGKTLAVYRWADLERRDRKGKLIRFRGLKQVARIALDDESDLNEKGRLVTEKLPALKPLFRMEVRFRQEDPQVAKQTGLERVLSQSRPDVVALGFRDAPFLATWYEKRAEVIAAGNEAICGGRGVVRVVDLDRRAVRWSHPVEGAALGLAVCNGRLIVSTTKGILYCFADRAAEPRASSREAAAADNPADSGPGVAARETVHGKGHATGSGKGPSYAAAAEEILRKSQVQEGYCLDLGCGDGRLALELVRRSKLYVVGIESDPAQVAAARQMLDAAGYYGTRVCIHQGDPANTPYPKYFANLIVSSRMLGDRAFTPSQSEIERLLRPFGGVACLGPLGKLTVERRGPLAGAGSWTHQNCNAAHTLCSNDDITGPLELLWFRDGVLEIPDRHAQGPAPLFNRGYLVVEGVHGVCAVDAYNGRTVWVYPIPGVLADQDGVHHDVGVGDTGSNFCLSDDRVFVRTADRCLVLDLATGRKLSELRTPVDPASKHRAWGIVLHDGGVLIGSVLNAEHTVSPRYANIGLRTESVLLFAVDARTGKLLWKYEPKHSIRNNAVAVAGGRVYLIDRPLALADRITNPKPNGKPREPLKPGEHPGGVLVALDAATGKVLWRQPDDIFGTQLAVARQQGVLLMYYQAVKHKFFRLPSEIGGRMAAFDTSSGKRLWDIEAEYKTRPLINGQTIYAEGGAWELLTGRQVPWHFERSYGCGQIAGSRNLMLFRSATLGYRDPKHDAPVENFGGIRPSCWFNAIAAGGLVLVPDGSSKCACSYQTRAWLALQHRE